MRQGADRFEADPRVVVGDPRGQAAPTRVADAGRRQWADDPHGRGADAGVGASGAAGRRGRARPRRADWYVQRASSRRVTRRRLRVERLDPRGERGDDLGLAPLLEHALGLVAGPVLGGLERVEQRSTTRAPTSFGRVDERAGPWR